MFQRLFFVTSMIGLLLVAGGCASNRHTVLTVHAEANAYERTPFYGAEANARIAYRLETTSHSLDRK